MVSMRPTTVIHLSNAGSYCGIERKEPFLIVRVRTRCKAKEQIRAFLQFAMKLEKTKVAIHRVYCIAVLVAGAGTN